MKSLLRCAFVAVGLIVSLGANSFAADLPKPAAAYYGVFRDLPVSDITAQGWLADFLTRQRDGLGGNPQVSGWPFTTCMWAGKIPKAHWSDYEQTGYFVDGVYRAGLLLKDPKLTKFGEENVKFTLENPQADGKLGPGQADFGVVSIHDIGSPEWPLSVFTRALIANYGATGNKQILDELTKTYLTFPPDFSSKGGRDVDTVEGMCWTYGQTGDQRLIDLAQHTYSNWTQNPKGTYTLANLASAKPMKGHGVSVCEASKQPALIYLYTGKKEYLDASVGAFKSLERDHELVDGVISSDEGLHGKAPEGLHETCDISDYTWSIGYLLQGTGDAAYGDKIERAVLNAGFGAIDKDFKAHQYFSSPNQVVSDQKCSAAKFGPEHLDRQSYRAGFATQCCTGNVHRFLPNYAARLWMGDNKGGLAATLYGPNTVKTKAGAAGTPVTFVEKTDYPFDGAVELTFTADKPVRFPLYLRIPGWAEGATVNVNDKPVADTPKPGTFLKIDRTFASGDVVKLDFPMNVRLETPVADGLSVFRGPLLYSLKIKEERIPVTTGRNTSVEFPAWDTVAKSPWNYALAIDGPQDLAKIKVEAKPVSGFPWTAESTPVVLTAPAKKIASWTLGQDGHNPALPAAPYELAAKTEEVELIPDGATHLRVSVFPAASPKGPVPTPAPAAK